MARALPPSRLKNRRRRRRVRLALIYTVGVSVSILAVGATFYLPFWRIETAVVSGNESVAASSIGNLIKEKIKGLHFGLLPRDNILLYPKGSIIRELKQEFSAVSKVSIRRSDLKTLAIEIVEYKPDALWCGESPDAPSPCLILDEAGTAYGKAVSISGSAYVRYYGVLSTTTSPRRYLTQNEFKTLGALLQEFEKKITEDTLVRISVDEYNDVRAGFTSGFVLVFALADDGAKILERYDLALQAEPFTTNPLQNFEYLDLRFGDKLYYKLKVE